MDGEAIREFRRRHRLTQVELAARFDISPGSVSHWAGGQHAVSRLVALAVEAAEPIVRRRRAWATSPLTN